MRNALAQTNLCTFFSVQSLNRTCTSKTTEFERPDQVAQAKQGMCDVDWYYYHEYYNS